MTLEPPTHTRPLRTFNVSWVRQVLASRRVAIVALKVSSVDSPGAAIGVDLGGSSKYSSENLED
jgi:hypothetical protein